MAISNAVSGTLKKLRTEHNMTQQELAERLNVSQSAVYYWENGKREPNLDMLFKISDVFHVGVDELIGLPEAPETLSAEEIQQLAEESNQENHRFYRIVLTDEEFQKWEKYGEILFSSFDKLNLEGKGEAAKRVEELTHIEKYVIKEEPLE